MTISIDLIKKLRDITLAPLGDCKEALVESNGDIDLKQEPAFIGKKTVIASIMLLLVMTYVCYKNQSMMPEFLKAFKLA